MTATAPNGDQDRVTTTAAKEYRTEGERYALFAWAGIAVTTLVMFAAVVVGLVLG